MQKQMLFRDKLGRRGIAAVEFALVVPVLLLLFMGTVEMLTAYRTEAKLNAIAFNVAQMVSLAQSVSTANAPIANATASTPLTADSPIVQVVSLNDICRGAAMGLAPFPPGGMKLAIASVTQEQGPTAQPANGTNPAYAASTTYDEWESDSTVASNGTCTTPSPSATTTILSGSPLATATTGASSMVVNPCDNVIIVQASVPYSGLIGLFFKNPITLTQTAYVRWAYTLPTTELQCTGCTLVSAPTQVCNANNTSTN
jgi:Flp pilus assembly protein TadG